MQQIYECKACNLTFKNKKAKIKHNKTPEHEEAQVLFEANVKAKEER